jgi:hypothetical protein
MATLRRGLVDTVKKAAAKVSNRGVQAATKAGTRGARALVETTVAAVRTVDKLQEKLGQRPRKVGSSKEAAAPLGRAASPEPTERKATSRASTPMMAKAGATRRASAQRTPEAQPVALREAGRKTMPGAAAKRSKAAKAPKKQFKAKRGQKHLHTGR